MDREQTLTEHLTELRRRIIICLAALIVFAAASFYFTPRLLQAVKLPSRGLIEKLVFFSPQEPIMIYMRLAFLCGIVISMPIILYQLWLFVSPAVGPGLRRCAFFFVCFSSIAFIAGCAFAYFIIIPQVLKFLLNFAGNEFIPVISADKYISFITGFIICCGIVFQMPVLSFLLTKIGIISAAALRKKYKYAVVIIFIAAAIITPTPDAVNMLFLAVPMLFLYELSIWISSLAGAKSKMIKINA